jgi:hypothetical protein
LILYFDARVLRGGAITPSDAIPAVVAGIREGLAARAGTKLFRPYSLGLLCEALYAAGDHNGALAAATEGLTTIDATGERWWEAELHRLRGLMLLMARCDIPEAEATFQRAIHVARSQQAKSLELRATTSLAGLWVEQCRRAEAHDLLAPVYGWFTEDFDIRICAVFGSPKARFVAEHRTKAVAACDSEARGGYFNYNAVGQRDRLSGSILDQRAQHRCAVKQPADKPENYTRLPPVSGDNGNRRYLARRKMLPVITETGQKHRD